MLSGPSAPFGLILGGPSFGGSNIVLQSPPDLSTRLRQLIQNCAPLSHPFGLRVTGCMRLQVRSLRALTVSAIFYRCRLESSTAKPPPLVRPTTGSPRYRKINPLESFRF